MSIDLSTYQSIQTALFCRIDVPDYEVLRFSNFNRPVTINDETYTNLGTLLNVAESTSDLRATQGLMSITIGGIPDTTISDVLSYQYKGAAVQVWRVFFDAETGEQLDIEGNPAGRFQGIVTNFSLEEEWPMGATTVSNKVTFTCSSTVDILNRKIAGRKTNPTDQKKWYPTDLSMDRVLALSKSNFNFGRPTT